MERPNITLWGIDASWSFDDGLIGWWAVHWSLDGAKDACNKDRLLYDAHLAPLQWIWREDSLSWVAFFEFGEDARRYYHICSISIEE